jgi:hypothetical protein
MNDPPDLELRVSWAQIVKCQARAAQIPLIFVNLPGDKVVAGKLFYRILFHRRAIRTMQNR